MKNKEFVSDVTLCITMGGRPDLLRTSLQTIADYFEFPQVFAINDFNDPRCDRVFFEVFPHGTLISDGIKRGHHGAINKLYECIETKFVLHTEDDWIFSHPIDFKAIKYFLEKRKDITSYCFRDISSFLKNDEIKRVKKSTEVGLNFFDLSAVHEEWYFYTFNPHLILFENIKSVGDFGGYKKERHISRFFKKKGKFVAYADPGMCTHIGDGLSLANPCANKKKSRLKVWIRQQINKLKTAWSSQS